MNKRVFSLGMALVLVFQVVTLAQADVPPQLKAQQKAALQKADIVCKDAVRARDNAQKAFLDYKRKWGREDVGLKNMVIAAEKRVKQAEANRNNCIRIFAQQNQAIERAEQLKRLQVRPVPPKVVSPTAPVVPQVVRPAVRPLQQPRPIGQPPEFGLDAQKWGRVCSILERRQDTPKYKEGACGYYKEQCKKLGVRSPIAVDKYDELLDAGLLPYKPHETIVGPNHKAFRMKGEKRL
jgi:hypothetical protein